MDIFLFERGGEGRGGTRKRIRERGEERGGEGRGGGEGGRGGGRRGEGFKPREWLGGKEVFFIISLTFLTVGGTTWKEGG